jgi:hypothetical protein
MTPAFGTDGAVVVDSGLLSQPPRSTDTERRSATLRLRTSRSFADDLRNILSGSAGEASYNNHELRHIDRLGHVRLITGEERAFSIFGACKRR